MELRISLPRLTTVTAVTNVYLLLSMTLIQVVTSSRPPHLVTSDNSDSDVNTSTIDRRSLDNYYYYYDDEGTDLFRPSIKFESNKNKPSKEPSPAFRDSYRDSFRPNRNYLQRESSFHRSDLQHRNSDEYRRPQQSSSRPHQRHSQSSQRRPEPHDRDVSYSQRQPPYRRQSELRDKYRPQAQQHHFYDYDDFDYSYGLQEENNKKKPSNIFDTFLNFLQPKKQIKKSESDVSKPSLEWLYNDISDENDLFIPNNADYDEGNIDLRDPVYDFKDVIHSIRNNETRIQTLKKLLSAASSFSDKAGTDPVTALTTMPMTILSILGVFYAVSAVAVLGYKYTLLTAGSSNGQAVALIPVVLLFSVPVVAAILYVTARSTMDGKISLTRLARGDTNWLRPDFDSVDFMYDVGVGASALLGLGWVVSIAL